MMASFEEQFEKACEARDIPGVVLLASDAKGKFNYQKAFGPKSPNEKLTLDATFQMASCTKLMTSISALQCVERGQIGLDDDVSTVLTELKDIQILIGFKEGSEEPIFEKAKNKVTLRQLLTHTSGFGYDRMNPKLSQWRKSRGEVAGVSGFPLLKRITTPLLFEPGTNWEYGTSLDWAGVLVMRLNNTSLEEYMQKYVWGPVGIKNITFHKEVKPNVQKNLVAMTKRGEEGTWSSLAVPTDEKVQWTSENWYDDVVAVGDEFGGAGLVGSAVDYMKVLHSICADDGKLLMSETIDEMFSPQISAGAQPTLSAFLGMLGATKMFTSRNPGSNVDYGLGGLLVLDDEESGLKKGTLTWSGLPNLLWTIDRESGLSLLYASNVVPFGDIESHKMQQLFEKQMYTQYSNLKVSSTL